MSFFRKFGMVLTGFLFAACGGGGSGGGSGGFALIEFLEAGQNNIPRNRQVQFRFLREREGRPGPFRTTEDSERRSGARELQLRQALRVAISSAANLSCSPRACRRARTVRTRVSSADGSYIVFISAGSNGLESVSGRPCRAIGGVPVRNQPVLRGRDSGRAAALHRAGSPSMRCRPDRPGDRPFASRPPSRSTSRRSDNATLLANNRVITPGAGGATEFGTPWSLRPSQVRARSTPPP